MRFPSIHSAELTLEISIVRRISLHRVFYAFFPPFRFLSVFLSFSIENVPTTDVCTCVIVDEMVNENWTRIKNIGERELTLKILFSRARK